MFKLKFTQQTIDWLNSEEAKKLSTEQSIELFLNILTLLSFLAKNGLSRHLEGGDINLGESCAGLAIEAIQVMATLLPNSALGVILTEFSNAAKDSLEESRINELLRKTVGMEC